MSIVLGIVGFVIGFVVALAAALWIVNKLAAYAVGRGLGW